MTIVRTRLAAIALLGMAVPVAAAEPPAGRVTGVGGVFFKSKDPKALTAWYRDVLGIAVESWGGIVMRYDAPGHPPTMIVSAFDQKTDMMAPSTRDFMINFAVDDLDAFLVRLKAKGVPVIKRDDTNDFGRFAWIVDPDGTKIELWEPKPASRTKWRRRDRQSRP